MNYFIESSSYHLFEVAIKKIKSFEKIEDNNQVIFDYSITNLQEALVEYSTKSLLEEKKLIIIKNTSFLQDKKLNKDINSLLKHINFSSNINVLIFQNNQINKENEFLIKNNDYFQFEKLSIPEEKELNKFVKSWLDKRKINYDLESIKELVSRTNKNFELLLNELNKIEILGLDLNSDLIKKVSFDFKGESIFSLTDYFLLEDKTNFLKTYDALINQGSEPFLIISRLISDVNTAGYIRLFKEKKDINPSLISKELEINDFRVKKLLSISKNQSLKQLLDLNRNLLEIKNNLLSNKKPKNEIYLKNKLLLII